MFISPYSVLVSSSDAGRYPSHMSLTDWGRVIFYPRWLFFWHLNNWSSPSLRPLPFVVSLFTPSHCSPLIVSDSAFDLWELRLVGQQAWCQGPQPVCLLFSRIWGTDIWAWTTVFWPLHKRWTGRLLVGIDSNSKPEAISWEQTMDLYFLFSHQISSVSGNMACIKHWLFCSIYSLGFMFNWYILLLLVIY